jgi:hypothetical protein
MLFMPLALSLTMAAHAQSAAIIKVSIPFAFNFGDQTFPAGDYSLVQPLQNYLVLRNSRGEAVAQTLTLGVDAQTPAGDTELRFEASGDQHILTEVWQKQDSSGQRLYPAKSRTSVPRE